MARLPHGYTNLTRRLAGGRVEKRYVGRRRRDNFRRELACLSQLHGVLPVPQLVDSDSSIPLLVTREADGLHGQALIDAGHGIEVMRLAGQVLAGIQALPTDTVEELSGAGEVIVHGDFGPQNLLFDAGARRVVAVLDWESAHLGQRVEDAAWAEWIVRMHHPGHVETLPDFFDAAGVTLDWSDRHAWMVHQCRAILRYCEESGMRSSADEWRSRLVATERWTR